MKCRRLLFNGRFGWLHRLWCADCRAHAQVDARIQWEIDRFAAQLAQEAQRRTPVPARSRVWGLQYAVLCVVVGAVAAVVLLSPKPQQRFAWNPIFLLSPKKEAPVSATPPKVVRKDPVKKEKHIPVVRKEPAPPREAKETLDYLNEDKGLFTSRWTLASSGSLTLASLLNRPLPPMKDDFVAPPEFLFASDASPEQLTHDAAEAEAEYRRQAAVSDSRLEKQVKFAAKNDSLKEVCEDLRKQTGVSIYAGRSVADDNVSIFIKGKPAKDVMRSLTRLFGYLWRRTGSEGAYGYTLEQEMKDQVAEDKLRNEEVSAALGKVVEAAKRKPQPDGHPNPLAKPAVEEIVRKLFGGLSIDEFQQLRNGREVVLSSLRGPRPIDADKALTIMDQMGRLKHIGNGQYIWTGGDGQSPSEFRGTTVNITYKLAVLELGGINASAAVLVSIFKENGEPLFTMPHSQGLAIVPGVGEGDPKNAEANADLAKIPRLAAQTSVKPVGRSFDKKQKEKEYPIKVWTEGTLTGGGFIWNGLDSLSPSPSYCATGDVWEAIHKATGIDIVADSFSRVFPSVDRSGSVFEVLNQYCDPMGTRWRYQNDTIYARSTTYAWQRLNETPKRLIEKWELSRKRGACTIHDLIAMAQLSDRQLDSFLSGKAIYHYHDIPEWGMVTRPWMGAGGWGWRKFLRALASVPPATLDQMVNRPLPLEKLSEATATRLLEEYGPWKSGLPAAVAIDYIPSKAFFWKPSPNSEYSKDALRFVGKTAEDVRNAVAKLNVQPAETEVLHTNGHLRLVFYAPNGKVVKTLGDAFEAMYLTGN